jgi:arylsulfatase A-like enzyme
MGAERPNVIVVFADQWRAAATGYAGDPNVQTPVLDRLAGQSANFTNAVSGCPVCSPYRASLITGQLPQRHGVFLNDLPLRQDGPSIADCFAAAGYDTGYIGKWHLEGHGRADFIPREHRQGFQFWRVLECTHTYNLSCYYGDTPEKRVWEGYDALAQTRAAIEYLDSRQGDSPFLLLLSWGPPHAPYHTAPDEFRALYEPGKLEMPPNVPEDTQQAARRDLAGYYAHCSALDAALGRLLTALEERGVAQNTLLLFTSDHGDLVGCHGEWGKQRPVEESVRVPFLLRCPEVLGTGPRTLDAPIDAQDIMPTLLSLCSLPIPDSVDGIDYADYIQGGPSPGDNVAVLECMAPFGNWHRGVGGREYRGVRTLSHTYVRDLNGPWLLFDNGCDPWQLDNLVARPEHGQLQSKLDRLLRRKLAERGDRFLPGSAYLERWGYEVDERGCILRVNGEELPGARGYRDF